MLGSTNPTMQQMQTEQALKEGGSIFAKPQLPAWRQNLPQSLGPTLGTAAQTGLDMADKLLAFGPQPLDAAGPTEAMAKVFTSGPQRLAQLAKAGKVPETALEKMFPAVINSKTGEVVHAMAATGPGGHRSLYEAVSGLKNFEPVRGFVDPATFYAYTEPMLEEILQKQHFGR